MVHWLEPHREWIKKSNLWTDNDWDSPLTMHHLFCSQENSLWLNLLWQPALETSFSHSSFNRRKLSLWNSNVAAAEKQNFRKIYSCNINLNKHFKRQKNIHNHHLASNVLAPLRRGQQEEERCNSSTVNEKRDDSKSQRSQVTEGMFKFSTRRQRPL